MTQRTINIILLTKGDKYINGFDKESMAYVRNESTGKRMYSENYEVESYDKRATN